MSKMREVVVVVDGRKWIVEVSDSESFESIKQRLMKCIKNGENMSLKARLVKE